MKRIFRFIAMFTACVTAFMSFTSCNFAQVQGGTQSGFESSGKDIVGYPSYTGDSSLYWTPLYLTTSDMKKESYFGGLGNNIKTDIVILEKSPDNLLVTTSNAGVLWSFDAGALWQSSGIGIDSLGLDAIACDPNNSNYVVAVSVNSSKSDTNGFYFSENGGQTWSYAGSSLDFVPASNVKLIFDKSSYNAITKKSSVIYMTMTTSAEDGESMLLRSDDSGKSFKVIKYIDKYATIAVHPTKSYVYLADSTGFYRSIDRGFSFEQLLAGRFSTVLVSPAEPDSVFLTSSDGAILTSKNSGQDFEEKWHSLPDTKVDGISISPTNANAMLAYFTDTNFKTRIVYSSNGGENWHDSAIYDNAYKMSEQSDNVRFAWSPSSSSVVYAIINNAIYKSVDGGALFTWSGNGDNSFDMNSTVSQNIHNPTYMAFAMNSTTIAFTTDGGSVWTIKSYDDYKNRLNIKAVYPVTRSKLIAIIENTSNSEYEIRVSENGGEYFNPTQTTCAQNCYFYSDPSDKDIIFASNLRSTDGGATWEEMSGCDYVLTHNPVSPNELFGVSGNSIVISYNKGKKWERLVNIGTPALDLSYDYIQFALYAATGDSLVKYYIKDGTIENCISSAFANQFGENVISLVESDPLYPNVVYAGGMTKDYINNSSILISEDSGQSWYVISSTEFNDTLFSAYHGGMQPVDMVLSANRELIVFSAKFGAHKLSKYEAE